MSSKKRLFLIDAMALAYRAYFAFIRNPLINSRGENVSAVFGFTNTLLNILDSEDPEYFAVIFDTAEPTFRHKLYTEYKAQRADMPQDMVDQLPRLHEVLQALNIPDIAKPGFEADDIIGTLSVMAAKKGLQTVIVSGDKDMMQLVSKDTIILNPKRSGEEPEWLDAKAVVKKIGLGPEKIIDYLALMGDSSDNIPGVKGIGPKTALSLIKEHDSLDKMLDDPEIVQSTRFRNLIKDDLENAKLSHTLVQIQTDMDLDISMDMLKRGKIDNEAAFDFFQRMEFNTLSKRFTPEQEKIETKYNLVDTPEKFSDFVEKLQATTRFAFDTETTSAEPMRAEMVGFSFSWKTGQAWYIPVKVPTDMTNEINPIPWDDAKKALAPVFADDNIEKCAHNAKYDMLVLLNHGIHVKGLTFDTMVANYLLDPSLHQHGLDALALKYFNLKKIPTSKIIGSGKKQITMDQAPVEKVSEYACEDADVTFRLWDLLRPEIEEKNLLKLLNDVELPLISVLLEMEKSGVGLDEKYLDSMSNQLGTDLLRLEKDIYKLAGSKFNINSPKQLSKILFEDLELPVIKKTKTGFSTDVSVLEELAKQHDLPKHLLEFRSLAKLKSTYVDALPKLIHPKTGRVHTSFNQTVAATGRLSSSDPNLQNIPIRTEIGRQIRAAFIAPPNHVILDADYSQIELRIMAHLSDDKGLKKAFSEDLDVHTHTASLIFDVDMDNVTSDMRRRAKEVNFGIMYGMGAFGLSQRIGIDPEEAAEFIQSYFANYPGVKNYMTEIVKKAREQGYVTTLLNRRRYIPEINSDNRRVRDFAERTAINTPIQGSAADMIKLAMIRINHRLRNENLASKMILQVHDELAFDVPEGEIEVMQQIIQKEMEESIKLDVPIKAEVGKGKNWLEAH